jgi:hypothetical protein
VKPVVSTPKEMCVESCQWWPSVAEVFSEADRRCMKATGPRAGSPDVGIVEGVGVGAGVLRAAGGLCASCP